MKIEMRVEKNSQMTTKLTYKASWEKGSPSNEETGENQRDAV